MNTEADKESAKPTTEITARSRTRSPNYPSMDLKTALDQTAKIWTAQHKHLANVDALLTTLGYSKKTGPAMRAVSALSQYGLTKETGAGDSRNIGLSELALDYILATDEDQKQKAASVAAMKPAIYVHLWETYGQHLPNDDTIQKHLIREKNFNAGSVAEVVTNYRATFDFAKLGVNVPVTEANAAKNVQRAPDTTPTKPAHVELSKNQKPDGLSRGSRQQPPMTSDTRYLPIPLDIGDAPIPVGMSEDDFTLLIATLNLWKKKIVRSEPPKKQDTETEPFDS
jgi:hypothetical protein